LTGLIGTPLPPCRGPCSLPSPRTAKGPIMPRSLDLHPNFFSSFPVPSCAALVLPTAVLLPHPFFFFAVQRRKFEGSPTNCCQSFRFFAYAHWAVFCRIPFQPVSTCCPSSRSFDLPLKSDPGPGVPFWSYVMWVAKHS